jgi:TolB-like protein
MTIWSAEIRELEQLYESIKGQIPDLKKELGQLIHFEDPNVIMLYSRRCLEVIITDLCECELKRPRKTEPLKGIIDKLHKEEKVPSHIISSMHGLNELSTYGTHPKDFDPEQVKPVLSNLDIIIKWYLKYKEIGTEPKTEPDEEIKHETKSPENLKRSIQISKKRLIGLVSGMILLIMIVASVLFFKNNIGSGRQTKELEKSIAVLPFINESPVDSNKYFINGIMEEVLNNLQKIKDFRVLSRTSTDQYKGQDRPTIPEIAKKLDVSYVVEGSGQKVGNNFRLRVQLIRGKGKEAHLWAHSYEQEIKETKDIFRVQSQIAQAIAAELKVVITPEEKQLIEKIPTANLTALEFYQMGREEEKFPYYLIFSSPFGAGINPPTKKSVERAEKMYKTALKYDSTFAPAYTGLAEIYWCKNYDKEYFSKNFMDSAIFLVKKALSIDDQLPDAHFIMGMYHSEKDNNYRKALEELDKTLKLNPNYWLAYLAKGEIDEDAVMALKDYHEAASRHHGPGLSVIYNKMSFKLSYTGFSELAKKYSLKAVKLESDSSIYYFWLWMYEFEYQKCLEYYKKRYSVDSTDSKALGFLSQYYDVTGQFKESLKIYKKTGASINGIQRIGYAYWKNGIKDSADYYFNKQLEYCNNAIKLGRSSYSSAPYDLAGVYAFKGDKIKAYDNLKIFIQKPSKWYLWIVRYIKYDPLFDSIRNEKEFQQIVGEMEAKYQADHERARKWLEDQRML